MPAPEATIAPDLDAVIGDLPAGPTRGERLDYIIFHLHKLGQRIRRELRRADRLRPHPQLLAAAVAEVRKAFPEPVCVETGCLRSADEGTESTLTIARALEGHGKFFTFELEPEHIETCKEVCSDLNERIEYVQGDAAVNLQELSVRGTLTRVHLAFLDSADDPDQIWSEFRAIDPLMPPRALLVVDDVVSPAVKGRRIKPYLHADEGWETRIVYTWKGLLVARKRD